MNDQDMQAQFIQWLAKKTGAKTEAELKQVVEKLQADEPTMQKVMAQFQAEMGGQANEAPQFAKGGKLDYIECLQHMKKGGKMDCGCGKKVTKGQLGMVAKAASLTPKIAGLVKTAKPALSLGQKALKFGMDNKKAIIGTIQGGLDLAKSLKPKNTDSTVITPSADNDYYGANAGAVQSPPMLSMQRQVPIFTGSNIPDGGIVRKPETQPALKEKGGKLKKKHLNGGILFADRGTKLAQRAEEAEAKGQSNKSDRLARRAQEVRSKKLVRDFNYQGNEVSPGVFGRERNKFDEGAETLLRAQQPLAIEKVQPIITRPGFNNNRAVEDIERSIAAHRAPLTPQAPVETTPQFKSFGEAFKYYRGKQDIFNYKGKDYTTKIAEEVKPVMKPVVLPNKPVATTPATPITQGAPAGTIEGTHSSRNPELSGTSIPLGGGRVPVYIGNNPTIINRSTPWNPLGSIGWIPTETQPSKEEVAKKQAIKETGIQAWLRQYGEAKAKGDKMGMRHWQDLLETAGGEGRRQP